MEASGCLLNRGALPTVQHVLDTVAGCSKAAVFLTDADMAQVAPVLLTIDSRFAPAMRTLARFPDIFEHGSELKTLVMSFAGMAAAEGATMLLCAWGGQLAC